MIIQKCADYQIYLKTDILLFLLTLLKMQQKVSNTFEPVPHKFSFSFQRFSFSANLHSALVSPPLRHLPGHPRQLGERQNWHDRRGPRRVRRAVVLPNLRHGGKDREAGGSSKIQGTIVI